MVKNVENVLAKFAIILLAIGFAIGCLALYVLTIWGVINIFSLIMLGTTQTFKFALGASAFFSMALIAIECSKMD